jgi:hypothetical protein
MGIRKVRKGNSLKNGFMLNIRASAGAVGGGEIGVGTVGSGILTARVVGVRNVGAADFRANAAPASPPTKNAAP